jgi:hypothetical protein
MPLIDDCKCGHGRENHHNKKHACLASFCDCSAFRDPSSPDPRPPRPDHANHSMVGTQKAPMAMVSMPRTTVDVEEQHMKKATIAALVAVVLASAFALTCALEGCKLHDPVPVEPNYPALSCPTARCKPAPAIDRELPWDAGSEAR